MIRFDNELYKREHDKNPGGLGLWAFIVNIKKGDLSLANCPFDYYTDNKKAVIFASDVMTLTEAKKEIEKYLKSINYNGVVYVGD